MKKFLSIAIDGPAGVGKTTLARTLAGRLGFCYVDTGALYRTLSVYFLEQGIEPEDEDAIKALLPDISIEIRYEDGVQRMYLNGADVTGMLRTPEVSHMASVSSSYASVRAKLLELQRALADTFDVVMDGRDIGTVVLPDADIKIFLTASPEVRARRRFEEMKEKGIIGDRTFEDILCEQTERDRRDSTRKIAPLRPADDALILDSSFLSADEVVDLVLGRVEKLMDIRGAS